MRQLAPQLKPVAHTAYPAYSMGGQSVRAISFREVSTAFLEANSYNDNSHLIVHKTMLLYARKRLILLIPT